MSFTWLEYAEPIGLKLTCRVTCSHVDWPIGTPANQHPVCSTTFFFILYFFSKTSSTLIDSSLNSHLSSVFTKTLILRHVRCSIPPPVCPSPCPHYGHRRQGLGSTSCPALWPWRFLRYCSCKSQLYHLVTLTTLLLMMLDDIYHSFLNFFDFFHVSRTLYLFNY